MNFDFQGLVYLLIALIVSLTLHEFAHAWMSHYLGDTTAQDQGRLSLNPLVHVDPIMTIALPLLLIISGSPVVFGAARPVPFNPWAVRGGEWGAALVAAAGPIMNLILAVFFAVWMRFVIPSGNIVELFKLLVEINVAFAVFNLIPIPPLDGSRILYAAAPPLREFLDRVERLGFIVILILFFVGWPFIQPIFTNIVGAIVQLLIPGASGLSA